MEYFAVSDVWMLALTAWQMLTGELPFLDVAADREASQAAAEGRARLNWDSLQDDVAPRELRALLAECCSLERGNRPTAAQVAQRAREILARMNVAAGAVASPASLRLVAQMKSRHGFAASILANRNLNCRLPSTG
jgi:hypothetical protein